MGGAFAGRLVGAAAGAVALAAVALPARAEWTTLVYELNVGGLGLAGVEVGLEMAEDGYRIGTDLRTEGIAKFLTGFTSVAASRGAAEAGLLVPHDHRSTSVWRGENRTVEIVYAGATPPTVTVVPSPEEDAREPVEPADLAGSVDPLTGVLNLLADAEAGRFEKPVKIFDGRRLYALSVLSVTPRPIDTSVHVGEGSAVRILYESLGGRSSRYKADDRTSIAEMHVVAGETFGLGIPVPVRLEVDTDGYGMIVALLRDVRRGEHPPGGQSHRHGCGHRLHSGC